MGLREWFFLTGIREVLAHFIGKTSMGLTPILEGDIHQQNADRVGCSRSEAKTLLYATMYGAGDIRLGHSLRPALTDGEKLVLGKELRKKFMAAIPGLEDLVQGVRQKVRQTGYLRGLDGRPIYCRGEHSALNFCCQGAGVHRALAIDWPTND